MKSKLKFKLLSVMLVSVCMVTLCAQDVQFQPLTSNETVAIGQKLASFERGTATLESLTDSQKNTEMLLEYYASHADEVTTKMKLPIAKSYAVWSKYSEAAKLAQDYVNVYSNDWHGWRVLGGCKLAMKSYNEAVDAIMNAVRLGDEKNYVGLGLAAVAANRLDIFETIVIPHLLVQMNDPKGFPEKQRNEMRGLIIYDALRTDKKEMFIKAIAGLDMSTIFQSKDLKDLIAQGCDHFKGADIDKIQKDLETATNVPPNKSPEPTMTDP